MVMRQWLWLPWNKKYGELGRKEINIARIRLISSIFAKDFIEESKDEIGRISFHLPKINDHTRSIKRKLVLVLSCSESGSKVNDTWIERTSDNAWRSAGKVEKERKKKKNRNCRRSNDCSNVGLNGLLMEFSSDSIELDDARLSVPILDAPLFSQIFIFATLPRFLADNTDAFMFRANTTKTTMPEDWSRETKE